MIKILYITNLPVPYRVDFFNELGKLCDLTVLFERKNANNRSSEWLKSKQMNFKFSFLKSVNIGTENSLSFEALNYVFRKKYDFVIIGGYSSLTSILTLLVLKLIKVKFFINVDGGFIKEDNFLKYRIKSLLISLADYWLSTGNNTDEYLIHYGARRADIFRYSFSSVLSTEVSKKNLSSTEKEVLKEKYAIPYKFAILSVGQFIERKGFDNILKIASDFHDDVGFIIIGGNVDESYLAEYKDIPSNVVFLEFKDNQTLKRYYQLADIFVLPTREDIWGLVINEAMAEGLPIITTTKCNAGLELVSHGENGYLFNVDDHEKLREFLKELLCDPDKIARMSRKSRSIIQKYTIENMAKEHYDIFNSIKGEI